MKRIEVFVFIILCFVFEISVHSQCVPSTKIYTPTNIEIPLTGKCEYTPDQIAAIDKNVESLISDNNWTSVEKVASASFLYNCHNYAWNLSEGGSDKGWMLSYTGIPDYSHQEQVNGTVACYFAGTSPSYHRVETISLASKVYYKSDHSAIANCDGTVTSKWGDWGLYKHKLEECIYNSNEVEFYTKKYGSTNRIPLISGSKLICSSQESYIANNVPLGVAICWDYSENLILQSTPSLHEAVFRAKAGANGYGWIRANNSQKYQVWIGTPRTDPISDTNGNLIKHGENLITNFNYYFSAGMYEDYRSVLNWSLDPMNNNWIKTRTGNIMFYNPGYYKISVTGTNSCGTGAPTSVNVIVFNNRSLLVSPNPASEKVSVSIQKEEVITDSRSFDNSFSNISSINSNSSLKIADIKSEEIYYVKVYGKSGTIYYADKISGRNFTIPVGCLKSGQYIIWVSDGQQVYSEQLIVSH